MDRIWQWAWDRHGTRYSWAAFVLTSATLLPILVLESLIVVGYEGSNRHLEAIGIALVATLTMVGAVALPGSAGWRLMERWAAGDDQLDRLEVLESTYAFARRSMVRALVCASVTSGAMAVVVGAVAGASASRLAQYAVFGGVLFLAALTIAVHSGVEALMRPVRVAVAGDSDVGDALPRSRPSYVAWSNVMILSTAFVFTLAGAALGAVIDRASDDPVITVVIATAMVACFAVPLTVSGAFSPSLQPLRDLAVGTERVAAGDYGQRLPVVQDDDLGTLVASFNRMQAGLAQRERLQAAFGSYVDPALATRLLDQGDDLFTGERREVTVLFVDIRDFTAFAEVSTAEDTVARLNALFEIVVPAVLDAGGHVNKYLGDGALAVFGAPNPLDHHADAAVGAALQIHQRVAHRFDGTVRIGTGINTGQVIAGTIGGGGKLEFTLIGDTVNVAARVEQLTKLTGDAILLTQDTLDALSRPPAGLADRGAHELKGKAATVHVHALDPAASRGD